MHSATRLGISFVVALLLPIVGRSQGVTTAAISGIVTDLMGMADRPDSVPQLRTITAPTLIVIGQEDNTTPLADAQLMAEQTPGARLAVIPVAGHLSNLEQPDVFNDVVSRFVGELR